MKTHVAGIVVPAGLPARKRDLADYRHQGRKVQGQGASSAESRRQMRQPPGRMILDEVRLILEVSYVTNATGVTMD